MRGTAPAFRRGHLRASALSRLRVLDLRARGRLAPRPGISPRARDHRPFPFFAAALGRAAQPRAGALGSLRAPAWHERARARGPRSAARRAPQALARGRIRTRSARPSGSSARARETVERKSKPAPRALSSPRRCPHQLVVRHGPRAFLAPGRGVSRGSAQRRRRGAVTDSRSRPNAHSAAGAHARRVTVGGPRRAPQARAVPRPSPASSPARRSRRRAHARRSLRTAPRRHAPRPASP